MSKENEKELSNKIICVCIFLNVYKLIYIYIIYILNTAYINIYVIHLYMYIYRDR